MANTLGSTKHFQVTQKLRKLIHDLPPGESIPSNRSLRQTYETSQTTIDRALSILRREGLITKEQSSRRLIVKDITEKPTLRVKLIRPDWPAPDYDFMLGSIINAGHKNNWAFDYYFYRSMSNLDIEHALNDCQAGVFLTTTEKIPAHITQYFDSPHIPVVTVQDYRPELQVSTVCADNRQASQLATDHLLSQGHRQILHIVPTALTGPMRGSIAGRRESMEKSDVFCTDTLLLDCKTPPGVNSRHHAYHTIKNFLQSDRPSFSAVYTATTPMMIALIRVLYENHISIPEQVSLITSDNSEMDAAYQIPPVTSIEFDNDARGQAVIRLLDQHLHYPSTKPREVWLQSVINHRKSVLPFSGKLI